MMLYAAMSKRVVSIIRHSVCLMDTINLRYGLKTIGLAVERERSDTWRAKSEHRSPNYLTDLDDILTVCI